MTPLSSRLATQPWNPKSDVSIFGSSFHMLGLTPPEQWTLVHNSGGQKIFTQKIINKNIFTEKENSVQVEMIVLPRAAARHFVVVVHNDHLRRKIRFLKKKLCNVLSCNLSGQCGYVCQVSVGTNRTLHCGRRGSDSRYQLYEHLYCMFWASNQRPNSGHNLVRSDLDFLLNSTPF